MTDTDTITIGKSLSHQWTARQKQLAEETLTIWKAKGLPTHGLLKKMVSVGVDMALKMYHDAAVKTTAVNGGD